MFHLVGVGSAPPALMWFTFSVTAYPHPSLPVTAGRFGVRWAGRRGDVFDQCCR